MRALRWAWMTIIPAVVVWGLWPGSPAAQRATTDRTVRLYQRMLERNPRDARAYYRLGDAYIQKARESGDVTYVVLAEDALRKSLAIAPGHGGALRHLAYVLYSRHEFHEAATQATRALQMDPTDSHALGILGDASLEMGKYAEAEAAYGRMIQLDEDLYSLSRLAGLKSLRGDPEGAIRDLERAIQAGRTDRAPAENVAWAQWQLGNDHFALGDLSAAETRYAQALQTYPNYHRALAGLAQVRAAQKRYQEAIPLYQKAIAIIPQPDYAAALGDVYTKIGRGEDARRQYALVEYVGALNTLNRVLYNRELASFYADHDIKLTEALDLARKELALRQDVYAHDLLAWALYKSGKPREAVAAMTEALKLGTKDARLFFHAGMIRAQLGEREKARGYLARALAINPRFHVLHAELAERTLTALDGGTAGPAREEARRGQ